MKYLKNDFEKNGTDFATFRKIVEKLQSVTTFEPVKKREVMLFSELNPDDKRNHHNGSFQCNIVDSQSVNAFNTNGTPLPTGFVRAERLDSDLLAELDASTKVILAVNNQHYYVGESAMATLCKSAGFKKCDPSLVRDMAIVESLTKDLSSSRMTLVVRTEESDEIGKPCKKIFACMSGRYNPIPLTIVPDSAEKLMDEGVLGKGEVRNWHVDHNYARIVIEFPEASEAYSEIYATEDKFIPGIEITSSDTGFSSVFIRSTLRNSECSNYVIAEEFARKHTGTITTEEILEKANDTILVNLRKLPERLAELMGQTLTPCSLATARSKATNRIAFEKAVKSVAKQLDLKKVLGQARALELCDAMVEEFNPNITFTAYDVAVNFMSLPDRVYGLSDGTITELRKACGKAPFCSYTSKTKKAEEEIPLVLGA